MSKECNAILAVDPGMKGGWAILDDGRIDVGPLIRDTFSDGHPIARGRHRRHKIGAIIVERQGVTWPRHRGQVKSNLKAAFSLGFSYSYLLMDLHDLPARGILEVAPRTWQKEMFKGMDKHLTSKDKSAIVAKEKFPNIDFNVTAKGNRSIHVHDGLTDAVCIALYMDGLLKRKEITL